MKDAPGSDSLCGVTVGMERKDVEALMTGCPMLWQYDEELAFTIRENAENELKNENLVVFFPREILLMSPTAKSRPGERAFKSEDFPTPDAPTKAVSLPESFSPSASRPKFSLADRRKTS